MFSDFQVPISTCEGEDGRKERDRERVGASGGERERHRERQDGDDPERADLRAKENRGGRGLLQAEQGRQGPHQAERFADRACEAGGAQAEGARADPAAREGQVR